MKANSKKKIRKSFMKRGSNKIKFTVDNSGSSTVNIKYLIPLKPSD